MSVATLDKLRTYADSDARDALPDALKVYATGSRQICPQVVSNGSDWDWVVLVPSMKAAIIQLDGLGFELGSSMEGRDIVDEPEIPEFVSMSKGKLNLIVTKSEKFFDGFALATRTAAQLGLTMKQQRILLFRAILYGEG